LIAEVTLLVVFTAGVVVPLVSGPGGNGVNWPERRKSYRDTFRRCGSSRD